jgi:hypothetical protein
MAHGSFEVGRFAAAAMAERIVRFGHRGRQVSLAALKEDNGSMRQARGMRYSGHWTTWDRIVACPDHWAPAHKSLD